MQVTTDWPPLRGDVFDTNCPSRVVLDHVTSKWAVLVLAALRGAPGRFSELRRRIGGVSEKMLSQTLRTLEADGFVHREVAATTPPQVTYSLTDLGEGIAERVTGLVDWISDRIPEIQEVRTR